MQVFFESRNPEAAQLREIAVRRVRFVLRRLTWFIPRAKVKPFDAASHVDRGDKFCHLELKTGGGGIVVIMSRAADWRSAIDAALKRAARAMLRTWKHGLTYSRRKLPALGFSPRLRLAFSAQP